MTGPVSGSPAYTHQVAPWAPQWGAVCCSFQKQAFPRSDWEECNHPILPLTCQYTWRAHLWDVGGSWGTQGKPTQTWGEHVNSDSGPGGSQFFSHQCYEMTSFEDPLYLAPNLRTLWLDRRPKNFPIPFRAKLDAFPCQFRPKYYLRRASPIMSSQMAPLDFCPFRVVFCCLHNQPQPYGIWFILALIKPWLLTVLFP